MPGRRILRKIAPATFAEFQTNFQTNGVVLRPDSCRTPNRAKADAWPENALSVHSEAESILGPATAGQPAQTRSACRREKYCLR